jgi:hypothetical protein
MTRQELNLRESYHMKKPLPANIESPIFVDANVYRAPIVGIIGSQPENTIVDSLVSDHIRALMAPQPTDVVSSDRHTVKPWFNGRIPESPRVVDLAKQDFPLVGGRLDVIGRDPCPTLVYRHQKHLISLTSTWQSPSREAALPALWFALRAGVV